MWKFLFKTYLRLKGWKYEANIPSDLKKFVLIAVPHTSNHDYPLAQAAFYLMGIRVRFLAKKSLFEGRFGKLFYKWGGIPVDRNSNTNLVDQLKIQFDSADELALVLSPEGTRKRVEKWKSGFYYIAKNANVPIACGYLDYKRKVAGIGPIVTDLSDFEQTKNIIRDFYRNVEPKFPENFETEFI